jgi:hypothetical protein
MKPSEAFFHRLPVVCYAIFNAPTCKEKLAILTLDFKLLTFGV